MGSLFCLFSAAGFGVMAIFAKLSYQQGVEVDALLVLRFGLAGALLLAVAAARGVFRGISARGVLVGISMGAVGYAAQAGLYFAALTRIDASQVAMAFSSYPLLVMVTAVLTRRERITRRRVVALTLALAGLALVLGGAALGTVDVLGALLSFGSALVYAGYILVGDRFAADIPALGLTALVCAGAFVSFAVSALARGGADLQLTAAGWGWLSALVVVSTVGAILLFFAGLAQIGPTLASLLGIVEPLVTVTAAAVVFNETLTMWQMLGGVVVVSAVAVVQLPAPPDAGQHLLGPPVPLPSAQTLDEPERVRA